MWLRSSIPCVESPSWKSTSGVDWVDGEPFGFLKKFFRYYQIWDECFEHAVEGEGCDDHSWIREIYGGKYWWEDKFFVSFKGKNGPIQLQVRHNGIDRRFKWKRRRRTTSRWFALNSISQ